MSNKWMMGAALVAAAMVANACVVELGGEDAASPDGPTELHQDGAVLFVVNNNAALTSYDNPTAMDGATAPTTELSLGASTSLFQPRAAVVTASGRLIVARQSGGLVGYDDARRAHGEVAASRVLDGPELDTPVSLAYEAAGDRLYVGRAKADGGVLVYDDASGDQLDGAVVPSRTFGPPDRAPYDPDGTIEMTIDAMALGTGGGLFVVDTSGQHINRSRILFYEAPEGLDGASVPDHVLTSPVWSTVEDIAVDDVGRLFVVNGSSEVLVFADAADLDGEVAPSAVLTIQLDAPSLMGLALFQGGMFVSDSESYAVHWLGDVGALDGVVSPDRTLTGFDTGLRTPHKLFVLHD